ncbi:MAG TPA: FmdB family zinc ribbon protein, partial [Jatrophihabitans sp.]|nr:FmdB family zinc ribbon protein [Jatrophihabitans sp.]
MPTYQYACTGADCGNRFELVQSFTDPAASECPVCGSPVRKVFSAVGVVFKGSGFYRTDSRNGSGKSSSLATSGKDSSDSSSS